MKRYLLFIPSLFFLCTSVESQNTSPYWSLSGNSNASSSSKLGTTTAIPLRIMTNNLERIRITPTGSIGIGTSTPASKLTVNIPSGSPLRAQIGGVTRFFVNGNGGVSIGQPVAAPAGGLYVAGLVGIGTAAPAKSLHVVGGGLISDGLHVTKKFEDVAVPNFNAITARSWIHVGADRAKGNGVYAEGAESGVFAIGSGAGPATKYGRGVDAYGTFIGVSSIGYFTGVYGHAEFYEQGYAPGVGAGVQGFSEDGKGGYFSSTNGIGVEAYSQNGYAGYFNGDVYTTGVYETSDESLKENVTLMSDAISKINQLKPSFYEFKKDERLKGLSLPKGSHYGLIAQDVEKIFPGLIKETTKFLHPPKPLVPNKEGKLVPSTEKFDAEKITVKAVNYTELIPILVRGIQEMDSAYKSEIAALKEEIVTLKFEIDMANRGNAFPSKAFMKQNVPNPVLNSTTIQYYIPNEARAARILVTNAKGQQLKIFNVSGNGTVNFSAGTLAAGTYSYSLVVDGKTISSKKMIIVK
jgi:hypothetical protein